MKFCKQRSCQPFTTRNITMSCSLCGQGLWCLLEKQSGRAFLALHEGKSLLSEEFEHAKGGGLEDLVPILNQDIYKNNPATGQSRFHVRNPHVVGAVLMHLEEMLDIVCPGNSELAPPRTHVILMTFPMMRLSRLRPTCSCLLMRLFLTSIADRQS